MRSRSLKAHSSRLRASIFQADHEEKQWQCFSGLGQQSPGRILWALRPCCPSPDPEHWAVQALPTSHLEEQPCRSYFQMAGFQGLLLDCAPFSFQHTLSGSEITLPPATLWEATEGMLLGDQDLSDQCLFCTDVLHAPRPLRRTRLLTSVGAAS